ncbi:MAG: cryptochrome/photolyase family protein, partial [Nanoarchaeota archaeon]
RDHAISADAGRKSALRILRNLEQFEDYSKDKDIPAKDATTHLSAHIKFGTCSLREIYHAIKGTREDHPLLRQLYWHDFFTYVAHHFPHVFGSPFRSKYKELEWDKGAQAEKRFRSWCKGNTGFPIVDAGMRQLNTSGFMHNRVRMIVASFLIKDLHIDWRQGERYFAKRLMDYDPAVNNGNWQWAASTGCDAQPYFRIFNPWRQQKRFDPECIYIKEWVPELQELDPAHIHQWSTECKEYWHKKVAYPAPIVCHDEERDEAKARYASVQ